LSDNDADAKLIEIGKQLTTKERGFDCRQCHAQGPEVLKLDNRAQGVGFSYIAPRLRDEFYARWILDPLRIDPGTKMPRFSPDRATTPVKPFLEGDARRQFEAIWHYLESVAVEDE